MSELNTASQDKDQSGKSEALKTYIEQTKLLVSLASGFVLAPPAILSLLRRADGKPPSFVPWSRFFWAEGLLVGSILAGYVVLGSIAGAQHNSSYDVHRPATRTFSIAQLSLYLAGIFAFLEMTKSIL
jgi:hypothetical protein